MLLHACRDLLHACREREPNCPWCCCWRGQLGKKVLSGCGDQPLSTHVLLQKSTSFSYALLRLGASSHRALQ
jgi:hypothetical protein